MSLNLFAGVAVDDFRTSLAWYQKLLGAEPSFFPHETEAVWQLDEGRLFYIVQRPENAGHALQTLIVEDLDAVLSGTAERGVELAKQETYPNGVRKITYVDPDGSEIAFGQVPR
ncbi:VOC family protein [Catenulispora sp. NF23]|uniref:VOC family protein n=1 Tax=Catenulispora pinistramenti TaxID=2705254 RepID=UPI001BA957B8|nr:VOC family protein [Catenulispora pinistramenti]MBS2539098.1 VOC family protein [Catenulispora pinistramenti]